MDNVLNKYFDNLFEDCEPKKNNIGFIDIIDKNGNCIMVEVPKKGHYVCSWNYFINVDLILGLDKIVLSEYLKGYIKNKFDLDIHNIHIPTTELSDLLKSWL